MASDLLLITSPSTFYIHYLSSFHCALRQIDQLSDCTQGRREIKNQPTPGHTVDQQIKLIEALDSIWIESTESNSRLEKVRWTSWKSKDWTDEQLGLCDGTWPTRIGCSLTIIILNILILILSSLFKLMISIARLKRPLLSTWIPLFHPDLKNHQTV
ncbi:hypothetical protein PSHT_09457 [Puccinia striiformis]|uniref:Uncharacterized protein n=1 Tax=Puccinia striiformis TaxID=27350 RepID=A0A2S4VH80_9BASI|nr:hypothetical protein PSHT_09457 [Puccinia striiformis]